MTKEDSSPDDGPDEPEDVGGFRFGMADGSGEASGRSRVGDSTSDTAGFDFQAWLQDNVPGIGGSSTGEAAGPSSEEAAASSTEEAGSATAAGSSETASEAVPEASVDPSDFAGFDFGRWLAETEVRTPSSTEPETPSTTPETAETPTTPAGTSGAAASTEPAGVEETVLAEESAPEPAEVGRSYSGFDFRQWMTDAEPGPKKPPESPRVVGASPSADRSALAGIVAALPFGGSEAAQATTYEGGFDFAGWLGEGDSEAFEPVDVEPSPTPPTPPEPSPATDAGATATASASAGFGEVPEFPTPPGGGSISDAPPVKLAALALFTAAIVAVALTASGAIAPFGPADGFGSSAGGDSAQEQPVASNNSTATPTATPQPTPEATPTTTPGPTATPTAEPTATPTAEPTATPTAEPTATPTPSPTPTPTPTPENDSNDPLDPLPI